MYDNTLGVIISGEEYDEYMKLKRKNTPMKKRRISERGNLYFHCPVCNYIVDNIVPTQKYCDRCGQRIK